MAKKKVVSETTPTLYPPWFPDYESFRAHVNALVARKEAEVRRGELGK
jgi:hypothetical protein